MQFGTLLVLLALVFSSFLNLSAAAPQSCTTQQKCGVVEMQPESADRYCGVVGTAHVPPEALIAETDAAKHTDCADRCLQNNRCKSFAFAHQQNRCLLFRETLAQLGVKRDATKPYRFWNATCFSKKCIPMTTCR